MRPEGRENLISYIFSGQQAWLFFVGWLLLGLITSALYALWSLLPGANWALQLVLIALAALSLWAIWRDLQRRVDRYWKEPVTTLTEDRLADPHRFIIVLVGPGAGKPHVDAVKYQLHPMSGSPQLEHCCYVYTPPALQNGLEMETKFPEVKFTSIPIATGDDVRAPYQGVLDAIDKALESDQRLAKEDLIVDITGGLKTMTAGAVIACVECGVAMQYLRSERDAAGNPIKDALGNIKSVGMKVILSTTDEGPPDRDAADEAS